MIPIYFIVPGDVNALSGGSIYNKKIIEELISSGVQVEIRELYGSFPFVNNTTIAKGENLLSSLPDGSKVIIDGLALPAFATCLHLHYHRLHYTTINHLPLALETGLSPKQQCQLFTLERDLLGHMQRIIVTSHHTAYELKRYNVPSHKVGVVLPGVEKMPKSDSMGDRAKLLCVANIIPRKGHLVLIEALALLKEIPWHLNCIGSKSDLQAVDAVKASIEQHSLQTRISLCGPMPFAKVKEYYGNADIFVLASFYETYGMVLAEALTCGLPIVATTAGAIPYTVPDTAGILVPPQDHTSLKTALYKILTNATMRHQLAQQAWQCGQNLPTWKQAAKQFLRHILHF